MKRLSLIFLILLTVLPAWGQAPIRRQFFTTNDNPIVDVVAGSNATVQASTPAANIRRFTVNAVPTAGQTNNTVVAALTNIVVVTNVSGATTLYSIGGLTDTNIVTAIARAQTNGLATTNFVLGSQLWTNENNSLVPTIYTNSEIHLGVGSGKAVSDTYGTIFIGEFAGRYSDASYSTVAIGPNAGDSATNSPANVFVGSGAGRYASTNQYNVGVGAGAGNLATDSEYNVFLGTFSGEEAVRTTNNVFIGRYAGQKAQGTRNSIIIGDNAGAGEFLTNVANSVFIGSNSGTNRSNTLWIDTQAPSGFGTYWPLIYGEFDNRLLRINGSLVSTNFVGNGAGLTNLPSGGTGSSNITDNAYYAVARNVRVNTNAEINNLTVTNLTVDSGSGIGYLSLENSGTNIIELNGTNGVVTATGFISGGGGAGSIEIGNSGTNIITLNGTNGTIISVTNIAQQFIGDGTGLTNVPFAIFTNYAVSADYTNVGALAFGTNLYGMTSFWTYASVPVVGVVPIFNFGIDTNTVITTNGGAFTGTILDNSVSSTAPANNQLVTAQWVRGIFAGAGVSYYSTTNINNTFTNKDIVTTNVAVYEFSTNIPVYSRRLYQTPTNNSYVGQVVTTNRFQQLLAGVTVNAYLEAQNGSGTGGPQVKPEIYVSYDRTNWFGDWDSQPQNIPEGATNLYSWVVSNPTYVSTNAAGFYVQRRFKLTTQTTPTPSDLYFHLGTNRPSHITLSADSGTSGNAYLAANQTFTGSNVFSTWLAGNGGGLTNLVNAQFGDFTNYGTNIVLSATNGNLQSWTITNASWVTLDSNTNYTETIRFNVYGSNTVTWTTSNLSNSASLGPTNSISVMLFDHARGTNLWWGYRLR